MGRKVGPYHVPLGVAGSVFRDEFDLAILQLQENNRLEILKRKWWEGGKCPKEEDHRAKGKPCTPKGAATEKSWPEVQGWTPSCTSGRFSAWELLFPLLLT